MKRNIFFISTLLIIGGAKVFSAPVDLSVGFVDPKPMMPGSSKSPILIPGIDLTDGIITFQDSHPDYSLTLIDEDGDVVFQTVVPTAVTTVTLPSWLSGEYEIRIQPDGSSMYFYGYVVF